MQPWVKVYDLYTSEVKEICQIKLPSLFFFDEKWRIAECQRSGNGCQVGEDLGANRGRTIASLLKDHGSGSILEN